MGLPQEFEWKKSLLAKLVGCFLVDTSGVIKLPILEGSNKQQMYGDFEGFPLNGALFVYIGSTSPPCNSG